MANCKCGAEREPSGVCSDPKCYLDCPPFPLAETLRPKEAGFRVTDETMLAAWLAATKENQVWPK